MATGVKRLDIIITKVIMITAGIKFILIIYQSIHGMFYMRFFQFIITTWPCKVNAITHAHTHTLDNQYFLLTSKKGTGLLSSWHSNSCTKRPGIEQLNDLWAIFLASGRKNQNAVCQALEPNPICQFSDTPQLGFKIHGFHASQSLCF